MRLRRAIAAAAAIVAVPAAVVVLGPSPTPPPCAVVGDAVPQPDGSGKPLDVRVATWNANYWNSARNVAAGIRAIGAEADVIGLQEFGPATKQRQVARLLPAPLRLYTTPGNMTGIVWNSAKLDVVERGVEQSIGVEHIEDGASGTTVGPRYLLWMRFRDKRTGAVFTELNDHLVPTIDHAGHPDTTRPRRLALYDQQIDRGLATVDRLKSAGPVTWTMDSNIDAQADAKVRDPRWPYVRLASHGLYSNWRALGYPAGGTHEGGRLIDGVWSTSATLAASAQHILPKHGSDHSPAVVTLSSRRPSATPLTAASSASTGSGRLPATIAVPGPSGQMSLDTQQITNSATIIAEGRAAGVPARGWVVALATALQESGIRMLRYGDRDSRNMFQQRPSAGWGTIHKLDDPHGAAQAFYGVASFTSNPGLTDIDGWQTMSVAEAAQAVQRSAFPSAYAKWEPAAQSIVQRLTGTTTAATTSGPGCDDEPPAAAANCPPSGSPAEKGLTPDAVRVLRCVKGKFPTLTSFGGVRPDPLPDHPSGRAVDVMIPHPQTAEGKALGWQIAHWLRDNRRALGVQYVIFDAQIWSVERDREGWRPYNAGSASPTADSSHLNHVHVTTYGDQGTGFQSTAAPNVPAGTWTMPLPAHAYRVGCGFACYVSSAGIPHTGQDFPTPVGTVVRSSNAGVVVKSRFLGDRSYGNFIVIRDANDPSIEVYYAHLSARQVTTGTTVTAGQIIGRSGNTGNSTGPHLHYEIRVNGKPVNPMPILRKKGVQP